MNRKPPHRPISALSVFARHGECLLGIVRPCVDTAFSDITPGPEGTPPSHERIDNGQTAPTAMSDRYVKIEA